MNRQNRLNSLLLAAGFTVLTVTLSAQSSATTGATGSAGADAGVNTGAIPGPQPGTPSPQVPPPVRPEMPVDPVTGASRDARIGTGVGSSTSTDSATATRSTIGTGAQSDINSSAGIRTDSSIRSTNGTGANSTAIGADARNHGIRGNVSIDQFDADRDGRLSVSEYSRSSLQSPGGPAAGSASAQTGVSGATTGVSGSSQATITPSETFRELDRDRDGYLSKSELEAARGSRITRP